MNHVDITVTPAASDYIQKVVAKDGAKGFRLSVKKTGCSGYSYLPVVVEEINPQDMTLTLATGMIIYIDPSWAHLFAGVTIDYVEENKSGIKQKRLVFINPKETGRCGCGESFHVE